MGPKFSFFFFFSFFMRHKSDMSEPKHMKQLIT